MTDSTIYHNSDSEPPNNDDLDSNGAAGRGSNGRDSSPVSHDRRRAETMQRTILRKSLRRRRARLGADDSIWVWLGTFGLVGWTVMVPTLAGLAFGIFLDDRITSSISFTITFLIVGIAIGTSMAWHWVRQESGHGDES